MAALVLLDSSTAFDSIDHDTVLQRLQTSYGVRNVCLSKTISAISVVFGVPQGSVLRPVLYLVYIASLLQLL